eukprot:SAG31_NODE_4169_length_3511_cov_7.390680_1_plen_69_part_00
MEQGYQIPIQTGYPWRVLSAISYAKVIVTGQLRKFRIPPIPELKKVPAARFEGLNLEDRPYQESLLED